MDHRAGDPLQGWVVKKETTAVVTTEEGSILRSGDGSRSSFCEGGRNDVQRGALPATQTLPGTTKISHDFVPLYEIEYNFYMQTPSSFQIIPLTLSDALRVLTVYRQCEDFLALGPVATASLEMVLTDMRHSQAEGGIFCGIVLDSHPQELAGVLDYLPAGFEGDPHTAFLELLMIAAPYRNAGLGAAVVAWLEERLRATPEVHFLGSGVQVNNPGGIRFWQRMGFRITGPGVDYPDQTTAYPLLKEL
jgi:GNAT superfamily N-acetyltransferase